MKILKTAEFPPSNFEGEEVIPQRSRTSWRQEEINNLVQKAKKLDEVKQELDELRRYLESSKFYEDTTVQVKDVLARLPHIFPDF